MLSKRTKVTAGIGAAAVLTATVVAGLLVREDWSSPNREPIPDQTATSFEVSGVIPGHHHDWANTRMRNETDSPATITDVELIPGGPSKNLMPEPEFFALGVGRSFGDGDAPAPTDASWWGVAPEPAVGYVIPAKRVDVKHLGVNIMVRLGVGDYDDVSFQGLRVRYEWKGEEYEFTSKSGILFCRAHREPGKGWVLAPLCRKQMRDH